MNSLPRAWFQSLVGELRSRKPCHLAQKKKFCFNSAEEFYVFKFYSHNNVYIVFPTSTVFIEPNQKLLKSPEEKVILTQSKSEK